jgi:plastocyanin
MLTVSTALAIGVTACSSASTPAPSAAPSSSPSQSTSATPKPPSSGGQAGATLAITGFAFSDVSVKAGSTVTVVNKDGVDHTVKVDGTNTDVTVPGNGQATFTAPAKAGTYPLSCDFHPQMHGSLTVTS